MTGRRNTTGFGCVDGDGRVEVWRSLTCFYALEVPWDALARRVGSPFVEYQWLRAWWSAYADAGPEALLLRGADAALRATAVLVSEDHRRLRAVTSVYSEEWNVLCRG